ncbi:response regulator transcription factor [Paenarthrobacter sp. NPDC091711]|uniref:response regulator transcription factor n=1 Tax=Paenarthrobacter sp. NPDC091711 TaxID=3364385 RepID=UPI00381B58F3
MDIRRAVVIEDDPDISFLISTLLQAMNYTVSTAETGPAGILAIRDVQPSLITTDLGLPDLEGVDVIREARKNTTAPILVISARADIAGVENAMAAGASGYLAKPFRPRILQEIVAALQVSAESSAG